MMEPSERTTRSHVFPVALLCATVSTTYILGMLFVTDGHFVPQVSDLYLIAQYAKAFAEGHPFQFNPGEAATSGATSLLHTLFLAVAHFIGFRGEGLIAFAIFTGGFFGFLTALQAFAAARALSAARDVAFLATGLVILNGPLAWSFHYGADIALTLFLATWLFRAWLESLPENRAASTLFVMPACLLVLARPEAVILVSCLAFWSAISARRQSPRIALRPQWFFPTALGLAIPAVLRLISGSAAHTSFSRKLLTENWGFFGAAVFSIDYWSDILRGVLLGFYPGTHRFGLGEGSAPYYSAPFLLIFFFLAFLVSSPALARAGSFLVSALVTALAITPTITIGVHFNRYLLFILPAVLVVSAIGIDRAACSLSSAFSSSRNLAFSRLGALACVFGILSVVRFGLVYADFAVSTYKKDEALFEFIRTKLPADATFLSNGTSIEFRTDRRSLNLSGVVTPGFTEILPVETEAAAFEVLSRPDAPPMPPFLIAQEGYVEGSPAWAAITRGGPVFTTTSLDGAEFAIYPTRNDLIGRQRNPMRTDTPAEWRLVDSLNVGDPIDERLHDYRFASSVGTRNLFAALKLDKYQGAGRNTGWDLADGGRVILGSEEFNLATPGTQDVWLVMRTNDKPSARVRHPSGERRMDIGLAASALRISTSRGRTDWIRVNLEAGWNEAVYRIPAALVEGPVTRLRIEGRYAAYTYWLFQAPGR